MSKPSSGICDPAEKSIIKGGTDRDEDVSVSLCDENGEVFASPNMIFRLTASDQDEYKSDDRWGQVYAWLNEKFVWPEQFKNISTGKWKKDNNKSKETGRKSMKDVEKRLLNVDDSNGCQFTVYEYKEHSDSVTGTDLKYRVALVMRGETKLYIKGDVEKLVFNEEVSQERIKLGRSLESLHISYEEMNSNTELFDTALERRRELMSSIQTICQKVSNESLENEFVQEFNFPGATKDPNLAKKLVKKIGQSSYNNFLKIYTKQNRNDVVADATNKANEIENKVKDCSDFEFFNQVRNLLAHFSGIHTDKNEVIDMIEGMLDRKCINSDCTCPCEHRTSVEERLSRPQDILNRLNDAYRKGKAQRP